MAMTEHEKYVRRIEQHKEYRRNNPDRIRDIAKRSYQKNATARLQYARSRYESEPYRYLLKLSMERAKKKCIPFLLTVEWARDLWTGRCALTGIEFVVGVNMSGPFSPSIDKIDPSRGYVPDNCRFILSRLNSLKSNDIDDRYMMIIAKALVDRHGN